MSPLLSTCMHVPFQVLLPGSRDPCEGPASSPWFWPLYFSPEPETTWIPRQGCKGEAAAAAQSRSMTPRPEPVGQCRTHPPFLLSGSHSEGPLGCRWRPAGGQRRRTETTCKKPKSGAELPPALAQPRPNPPHPTQPTGSQGDLSQRTEKGPS